MPSKNKDEQNTLEQISIRFFNQSADKFGVTL